MQAHKEADFTLDLRGESCPYPVIYTLEALEGMNKGELLQVITDCPGSFRNVPEEREFVLPSVCTSCQSHSRMPSQCRGRTKRPQQTCSAPQFA